MSQRAKPAQHGERTLKGLRDLGYTVDVAEKTKPGWLRRNRPKRVQEAILLLRRDHTLSQTTAGQALQGLIEEVDKAEGRCGHDMGIVRSPMGTKEDLFNYADMEAFDERETVHVQVCAMSGRAAHHSKISSNPAAHRWVAHPDREIEVWAWRKLPLEKRPEGQGKKQWFARRTRFRPGQEWQDLGEYPPAKVKEVK